ncbi:MULTISPECIES: SDR family NAD(P)-dependent oxidoreductase [unclassified Sphingomonas]|uniref:SDR family NAD(P)-dependent oxidoreductase n=1 Tax=unclassified Sphingomonas TaxID=196159 RepID=UPI0006F3ACEE|nr:MULTISPECIES: SDR family NAD(P)-dependent oxidoreductase [unclassified Sphingomonas]KQM28826.1 short-chain dehydrogenase [Sphingomonas sp. Leaf9]KQM45527.1 short-chain dehydrogenase [Sphingomonas sp. Leaf11]
MQRLDGARVALTGAAGGLGGLLADRFRAKGAQVLGIDRAISPACDESATVDLSDMAALDSFAAALAGRRIDILVNAAGLQYFGAIDEQGVTRIATGFAVNLVAPAILSAALVPQMRARGAGGIVNIGSMMGAVPYPFFTAYSSAKAGLKAFSQALRREVAGSGITVTHVAPRAVNTPLNTPQIRAFMDATRMRADRPEAIADRIVAAIERGAGDVAIGGMERVFSHLNALAPRLIDHGLRGQIAAARALLSPVTEGVSR